jgi:hypothetical protein
MGNGSVDIFSFQRFSFVIRGKPDGKAVVA